MTPSSAATNQKAHEVDALLPRTQADQLADTGVKDMVTRLAAAGIDIDGRRSSTTRTQVLSTVLPNYTSLLFPRLELNPDNDRERTLMATRNASDG